MSRGQQTATFNQTQGESKEAFGDAENALGLEQGAVGDYQTQLGRYAAENPFQQGGEFQNDQNMVLANTADASAQAAGARLQSQAARTGQNPAGAIGATEAMQQENERSLASQEAGANTERIGDEAGYNKSVLSDYGAVPGMEGDVASGQSKLYGTSLGVQEDAAKTPGFLDTLEGQLVGAGDAAIGAFCPAEGSLYLMADGSERPVESLQVGDLIMSIDDEPQIIEEIQSGIANILLTQTEDGHLIRTSPTHAFALPRGGFVIASRSAGKTIVTKGGFSKVSNVQMLKVKAYVFNVITDGSHTYRANGLWSLGVGDAERHVGMNEWAAIGGRMCHELEVVGR